jgi:hypothetical protein
MGYIEDEIRSVASQLDISLQMDKHEADAIRQRLAEKFSTDPTRPLDLSWQNLKDYQTAYDYDQGAWEWIQDYVKDEEVILFLGPDEEETLLIIPSGYDLTAIIGECTGFPFCITSRDASYILCLDDHNCLIGSGKVVEWLRSRKQVR